MCNIEWKGLRAAIRREKNSNKTIMCKLVHKQWPTMYMLERNGMSTTDKCPLCMHHIENWDHVFKCKGDDAIIEKNTQLNLLQKKLKQCYTHPVLRRRLMAAVLQWTGGHDITHPSEGGHYDDINEALRDQCNLLFENIFCGVMSHKFVEVQGRYYDENVGLLPKRRLCGHEWGVKVIRAFMEYSKNVWKNRCDIVHEGNKLSLENQIRASALKLWQHLRSHPWEIRLEDGYLLKKPIKFFSSSSIVNLRFWIRSINVSREIALNHEQTTKQDIRKWLHLPEQPRGKKIRGFKENQEKLGMRRKKLQQKLSNCWKKDAEERVAWPVLGVDVQDDDEDDDIRNEEVLEHSSGMSTFLQEEEEQNKKIQVTLPTMITCVKLDEELSLWDDIRSVRAFDEYREETDSVESMQIECIEKTREFNRFDNEKQELGETNDVHGDNASSEASGVDHYSPPLSDVYCTFQDDVAHTNENDVLKIDDDGCTIGTNTSKPKMLSAVKNWFIRKLGVWKERDYTMRDSVESDEIVFVEETRYIGDSEVNTRPSEYESEICESAIQSEDSSHNVVEYETRLEMLSDCVSSVSSRAVDIKFDDYFNAQCGHTNPIRNMLNDENSESENKYNWKEFFPSANLGDREYQRQYIEDKNKVEHLDHAFGCNSGSVSDRRINQFVLSSESISKGSVDFPDELSLVVKKTPFIDLSNKHDKSTQLRQILEDMESSCGSVDSCGEYEIEVCEIVEIEDIQEVVNENCNTDPLEQNVNMKMPNEVQRSIIRPSQKEEVETFRGSSGSRVVKQANGFFHQVIVVDEASLQQCAHVHDEKKRNRDPVTSCKQLQHISNALPQVQSQQKRSQRILESDANSVNSTINAMKQQENDSNSHVKSQSMQQHLSFLSKQSQNNVMLNHKSYLRKARARMSIHCQDMNGSNVICAQSFLKFSLSGRVKLTNELRMTSVEKDKNCQVMGFKDGTELANEKSIEGKNEVGPSTYPTGCPNNYFFILNKTNIKS